MSKLEAFVQVGTFSWEDLMSDHETAVKNQQDLEARQRENFWTTWK